MDNEKIYQMDFARIYPLLVNKLVRKGRTPADAVIVIAWLTGYTPDDIARMAQGGTTYRAFFEEAPCLHPDRHLITGTICGIRVEDIADPLMQDIRRLDKLIDELAKGKPMEKVLRKA